MSKRMEVFLEVVDDDVCVTKVRPEGCVNWQHVKEKYWDLEHHPALRDRRTVDSAIDEMKSYRTVQISMTDGEAMAYKRGNLLQGAKTYSKAKNTRQIQPQTLINYKEQNKTIISHKTHNHFYNAGPSTSSLHRRDDHEDCDDSEEDGDSEEDDVSEMDDDSGEEDESEEDGDSEEESD